MKLALQIIAVLTALAGLIAAVVKISPSSTTPTAMTATQGAVQVVGNGNQVMGGQTNVYVSNQEVVRERSRYTSERFGFSFEYPKAWGHTNEPANGDGVFLMAGSPKIKMSMSGGWRLDGITRRFCTPEYGDMNTVVLESGRVAGFTETETGQEIKWETCACDKSVCVETQVIGLKENFLLVRDHLMLTIKSIKFGKPYGA